MRHSGQGVKLRSLHVMRKYRHVEARENYRGLLSRFILAPGDLYLRILPRYCLEAGRYTVHTALLKYYFNGAPERLCACSDRARSALPALYPKEKSLRPAQPEALEAPYNL